jgi:hypothetical protein
MTLTRISVLTLLFQLAYRLDDLSLQGLRPVLVDGPPSGAETLVDAQNAVVEAGR